MTDTARADAPAPAPAHDAARHWGLERLTSLAALALFVWLFVSLWRLPALDWRTVSEWLKDPLAATPMLLLILVAFAHLKMGLMVIVDDYVHDEGGRLVWLVLIKFASILAAVLAAFCVLKIALGGAAG
jgi:succinate dehydrogenase / fumarate reductase, membrane anchor subunit